MSKGKQGCLEIEFDDLGPFLFAVVKFDQPPLVGRQRGFDLDVHPEEPFVATLVGERDEPVDPGRSLARQLGGGPGKAARSQKVFKIDALLGIETTVAGSFRDGAGDMKIAQWIRRSVRIAPEPVDAVPVECRDHAVGSEDLAVEYRLAGWGSVSQQLAVAIDPGPGHPVDAFSDVQSLHLQRGLASGGDLQSGSPVAESVLGEFVAVAADVEEDPLVHQPGFVKGDTAGRVGVVTDVVDGLQLDQRHASTCRLVNDVDFEVASFFGCRSVGRDAPGQECQCGSSDERDAGD